MRKYLILAQSQVTAQALNALLPLLGQQSLPKGDKRLIVWETEDRRTSVVISSYESLVSQIEEAAKNDDGMLPLNEVVILIDSAKPSELSAVDEEFCWENLLALLILTFPEIHWCFGLATSGKVPDEHSLESIATKCLRNSLLDAVGLRSRVRTETNQQLEAMGDDLRLLVRTKRAAVIDEERDYAYFNGYTAYRFGSVVDVVSSWGLMEELFGGRDGKCHDYWLLFEDMSLNFADKPSKVHLLRLNEYPGDNGERQGRAYWCPKLDSTSPQTENSDYRYLVTTGQARDDTTLKDNDSYLREKKNGNGGALFKPGDGMFGLWGKAKLYGEPSWFKSTRDQVDCDCLPDEKQASAQRQTNSDNKGHGSPGKLMMVADMLIRRSRVLLDRATCVETAVQGAVLATDAFELTGGRTPTTAIGALALKHQFEILAECQFYGVGHHIETDEWRWEDIQVETARISHWFQPERIEKAKLDAQMYILNQLVPIFREHNKFEEEQQYMIRARNVHNTLWLKKHLWRLPFTPFLRYFELLMSSFLSFVVCLGVCVVVFACLFTAVTHYQSYWHGVFDAVSSVLAISGPATHEHTPNPPSFMYSVVVSFAIVMGIAHLGVFVSHLYTLVSRK